MEPYVNGRIEILVGDAGTLDVDAVIVVAPGENVYRQRLQQLGGGSIAFVTPRLDERAAKLAIATVVRELREQASADRVVFCCATEDEAELLQRVAERTISAES